ncbi:MAG: LacI family DNA-binding transcriptional regulator [Chloroflexota bacterium]
MTSISDVAKLAGVSVTTVSRVMNNDAHRVNEQTRRRVLEAIETLNYVPNMLARALASDKTRMIGVIVGDASDPYFATIVRGISDAAREHNYLTLMCNTDRIPEVELNYVRTLRDYNVDGIIFAGGGLTEKTHLEELDGLISKLQANHVPVVALGNHALKVPQVRCDDTQCSYDMTEYLIRLGHRRIGFISGPDGLTTSALRLDGYRKALDKHGIPFDAALVSSGDFTVEGGQRAADYFVASPNLPTAIFGANDREALGCLFQLQQHGIDVPGQVSVAGLDDIETAQYVYPSLTTIRIPMYEIGAMGMQQILQTMHEASSVEAVHILPYSLIERGSTAAVSK